MALSYTKTKWQNRAVQRPRTYTESENSDGSITHTPAPGTIAQAGTPLSEDNLNHMEEGIWTLYDELNKALETIEGIRTTLSQYNTRIGNNERSITSIQAVDETQSGNIWELQDAHNALAEDEEELEDAFEAHTADKNNPHGVTKSQVGLGNVPNVATNDQTPTYTAAGSDQELSSGENLATAFGKLKRAVQRLYQHMEDTNNPHNTGIFDAAAVTFLNEVGEPDYVGAFTGNGVNAATLQVNGQDRRGQMINTGFVPSLVVIVVPYDGNQIKFSPGMSESGLTDNYALEKILTGFRIRGFAVISPGQNYYHSGCGATYQTAAPEAVLGRNHGGAVIYGNGFIVQSYNNANADSTMYMNANGWRYVYLAWR